MQCSAADYERGGDEKEEEEEDDVEQKWEQENGLWQRGEEKGGKGHLGIVVRRHMPVWTELEVYEG